MKEEDERGGGHRADQKEVWKEKEGEELGWTGSLGITGKIEIEKEEKGKENKKRDREETCGREKSGDGEIQTCKDMDEVANAKWWKSEEREKEECKEKNERWKKVIIRIVKRTARKTGKT
jgi:hypothetical protein